MKIAVNGGHTPTSPGAGMYLDEVACDRAIKDALVAELRARGHEVADCTADDWMAYPLELNTQVSRANASGAELGISIHLNAGGGTGTEVLYHPASAGGWGQQVAQDVSAAVASRLGLPNRGAKQRSDLWWLNGTSMTAVLVEVCFVDHRADEAAYNAVGPAAIAFAIADAVVGGAAGATPAPEPAPVPAVPDIRYRVRAGGVWLPEMVDRTDTGGSGDTYAGNGQPIEYLAMDFPGWYQVCTEKSGWLPKVYAYNPDDLENGCAGDGSPIKYVRCYYETQDPDSTGWLRIRYAVANVGCGFFAEMEDLTDLSGYGDDAAGNGGTISAFYAYLVRA